MNDIELVYDTNGFFDWNFDEFDVSNVIGDQQLISACAHSLSLKYGELEQPLYESKGNVLDNFMHLRGTEDAVKLVKEEIENELNKIEGIKSANADIALIENNIIINKITITKANGGSVEIAIKNKRTDTN